MARRGSLHDVELVEGDEPDPSGAPDDRDADTVRPARRARRRWVVAGAVVAALALVVAVAGQRAVDADERARIAAVAGQPAAVGELDGPPSVRWKATSGSFVDASAVRTADGRLVTVRGAPEGSVAVVALDASTGAEVWSSEVIDGGAGGEVDSGPVLEGQSGRCVVPAQEHVVVCLVHDGRTVDQDDGLTTLPPSVVRVVVLDVRDGTVVRDLADALGVDPTREPSSIAAVGELVVVADMPGDGQAYVRAATTDGTRAWERTMPLPPGGDPQDLRTRPFALLHPLGDVVVAFTPDELLVLDATGTTVRSVPTGDRLLGYATADFAALTSPYARGRDGAAVEEVVTLVHADGTTSTVRGGVLSPVVDDGSVAGLVLTHEKDVLTAWDRDGTERWTARTTLERDEAMVLDGRVHVDTGGDLVALDARTGDEVWRRSDVGLNLVATDGRHLLAVGLEPGRGARSQLVAVDPSDGSETWRAPLPDGTTDVVASLGLLVALMFTDDGSQYAVLG